VLVDSLLAAIVTNIIMIILMRRRREDMNYKISFKNILLGVIIPVLILIIWAIMMLKSYSDRPKVFIESPAPLPIIDNDQKTVALPSMNVPTTLIPVK
jgi:predicted Na+-dependent transporter